MPIYTTCLKLQNLLNITIRNSHVLLPLNNTRLFYVVCKKYKINSKILPSSQQCRHIHSSYYLFKRRKTAEERKSNKIIEYSPKSKSKIVEIWRGITMAELAKVLEKDLQFVQDIFLNLVRNPNEPINDIKQIQLALQRGGCRMKIIAKPSDEIEEILNKDAFPRPPPAKKDLKPRPPVVTVMGHVDHGKTTLLDALRHSSVVDQEFGGITQHIGAFSVMLDSGARITFLDTPGHAAFSAMRARGANLTDIVVLVVAADDGVMEQTVESIKMARQAKVPILVAINKIDAPKADISRTEQMLVEVGIQVEKLGGDVQAIPVSALKKKNLDKLTEALILQAELLEIRADPTGPVEATVVESKVHPYRGRLCTLVVQRGTLQKGDILVAGNAMAKVRNLKDSDGKILEAASPGCPVEVEGWKDLPSAGDQVLQVESERRAKEVLKVREHLNEKEKLEEDAKVIEQKEKQHQKTYKEQLETKRKIGRWKIRREGPRTKEYIKDDDEIPSVNIILKADVDGTLEALLDTLDTYECDNCKMDLVHYGVGSVTQNDIEMAEMFDGIVYAFNVELPTNLKAVINEKQIDVRHHNVIYKLIDDVKEVINSKLPAKEVEEEIGEATVMQQFEISQGKKKVPVAGCKCVRGNLKKIGLFKLVRNGEIVFTGHLSSMRHLKSEVDIIKADTECGLQLEDATVTFQKGDTLLCFEKKTLQQNTDWDPGF